MRSGPHWTDYPPDDPPQGEHFCDRCRQYDDDCQCQADDETLEQVFMRPGALEIGQVTAAFLAFCVVQALAFAVLTACCP